MNNTNLNTSKATRSNILFSLFLLFIFISFIIGATERKFYNSNHSTQLTETENNKLGAIEMFFSLKNYWIPEYTNKFGFLPLLNGEGQSINCNVSITSIHLISCLSKEGVTDFPYSYIKETVISYFIEYIEYEFTTNNNAVLCLKMSRNDFNNYTKGTLFKSEELYSSNNNTRLCYRFP